MSNIQHDQEAPEPEHGPNVVITVNGNQVPIHRGHQTVAHIKQVGGVAAAEELEQIIDGVFTPLPDGGGVTLKSGEVFVSHVRASAGS
jgi:hypothetical protein